MSKFSKKMIYLSITLGWFAACRPAQNNTSKDIFAQDLSASGNERRRPATESDTYWAISMGGCTGHLIAPDVMMTAAHCSPRVGATYKSGVAIVKKLRADITVMSILEIDRSLDYAVLSIRWNGKKPDEQKFPSLIAHQKDSLQLASGNGKSGDLLFTVGFPTDKSQSWGVTYAQGYPKQVSNGLLRYNIGIINGNSGGGVWRKSDGMLVSLTNGGPNAFGQGQWSGGDEEDPNHWNHGAAMWNVYAASKVVRDIFPNGKNRFANDVTSSSLDVFVSINQASTSNLDSAPLLLSIPTSDNENKLTLCQTLKDCELGNSAAVTTTKTVVYNGRQLLTTNSKLSFKAGDLWHIVTSDVTGNILGKKTIRFTAK